MDRLDREIAQTMRPRYAELAMRAKLSDEERDALWMYQFEKCSVVKISMQLYCSERTVFRMVKTARQKICNAMT